MMQIFIPKGATTNIELGLVTLTEAISKMNPDLVSQGLLGGRFGYGANYENDVFMMHPYCWCDKDDCVWCGDECAPNFHHFKSDLKIWWYKWIGRGMDYNNKPKNWNQIFNECVESLKGKDEGSSGKVE